MCPFRGAKAPPAVHFTGFLPQWTFPMGARLPPHGTAVRGGRKIFAGFMAKNFVAGASHPGQMEREGLRLPPESPQRETGRRGGGRREDCCAIRRSFLTHRQVCRSAGHGATEAARPERSLQARFFTHRTVATARNRASGFGGDWRVRKQLPVVVGPDDRMPPGSREPKWAQ